MERVLVLGCPGSGKTYFSKRLSNILNLPLIHMDNLYWNKDKTKSTKEELLDSLKPILQKDEWILDGNYHHTLDERLKRATDVFFFSIPLNDCLDGIRSRINVQRDDIPWIETKEDAESLIEWSKTYKNRTYDLEIDLLKRYKNINVIIFKSRDEVNRYLNSLENI